jgi:hypothetical protein
MGPDAEKVGLWFELQEVRPFSSDADALHWPRTDDDVELEDKLRELKSGPAVMAGSAAEKERNNAIRPVQRERWMRHTIYTIDLANQTAQLPDIGRIVAEYDDLAGAAHVSSARLQVAVREERQWDQGAKESDFGSVPYPQPNWAPVVLGPMFVDPVSAAMGGQSGMTVTALVVPGD